MKEKMGLIESWGTVTLKASRDGEYLSSKAERRL